MTPVWLAGGQQEAHSGGPDRTPAQPVAGGKAAIPARVSRHEHQPCDYIFPSANRL